MANNITNELTFSQCSRERCQEILKVIQKDDVGVGSIDFNKIIPQPENIYMGDLGPKEMELFKDKNWYDWRLKNWGTKWNSYGYRNGTQYDKDKNQISFLSANSSARKVVQALSHKYPDVLFELRYSDEDLGYNVGEISIVAGEDIDGRIPNEGTFEAQELAADIMGITLNFDINSGSGYVLALNDNIMEYCEGVHVSESFQCDASLGHPVVLCYDEDNGKAWLECFKNAYESDEDIAEVERNLRNWGIHPCRSWDEYNGYVKCLGDDAMEAAYHNEEGMTLC